MISRETAARLRRELSTRAGLGRPLRHDPIRTRRLSGVERLRFADGSTAVVKIAAAPFTSEHKVLRYAAAQHVPVPKVLAAIARHGTLGTLMEDLGAPVRDATDTDAATAAAQLHAAPPMPGLRTLGTRDLAVLPAHALICLSELRTAGRFTDAPDLVDLLAALDNVAVRRADGAERPPFGLCHGDLHPATVHIGANGWRLLDLAKAFNGPGLLDLATWQGTRRPPDPGQLRTMIEIYVDTGGPLAARAQRGGLPAEAWALGWHHIHAAHRHLEHATRGIHPPETDADTVPIIRHQLTAATELLRQ